MVQSFIQRRFLESQALARFVQSGGRFRSWLIVCARNFMRQCDKQAKARKNRPAHGVLSLEQLRTGDGGAFDPPSDSTPETAYDDAWVRGLLETSLCRAQQRCLENGRERDYRIFAEYYLSTRSPRPTWKELAKRYDLPSWKVAVHKADWVKLKLAEAVRSEIRRQVNSDEDVDDELRKLLLA